MQISSFKDMYFAELQELFSAEAQLGALFAGLAEVASHPALKDAFSKQQRNTQVQKQRLEAMLSAHGAVPGMHTDQAMQALASETAKMVRIVNGEDLRDAAMIASAQRLKHYEIAAYGTAAALAGQLELRNDQKALHRSLEEEKLADNLLTQLAEYEVNQDAAAA